MTPARTDIARDENHHLDEVGFSTFSSLMGSGMAMGIVTVFLLGFALKQVGPLTRFWPWAAGMPLLIAGYSVFVEPRRLRWQALRRLDRWAQELMIFMVILGLAWGLTGWLFFATDTVTLFVLVVLICGLMASVGIGAAMRLPAGLAFCVPVVLPFLVSAAIADDVPGSVKGDSTRLRQNLLNLLSNALKFTEAGQVRLTAEKRGSDELHFAVLDSGIGLTPADTAKLFQSFSQADSSTTRKYGGTGLGLVISKRLAEVMGGTMSAESAGAGQGSTFRFHIKAEPVANAAALNQAAAKTTIDPQMAARHPLRILLAEDNLVNQKLALRLLGQMGYSADVAVNGLRALEAVEAKPCDLVLMDVQMPEMDGLEASRRITAKWRPHERPRIVAMTANAMQGDRELCLSAGMDDYVTKPIRVDALVQALQAASGRRDA